MKLQSQITNSKFNPSSCKGPFAKTADTILMIEPGLLRSKGDESEFLTLAKRVFEFRTVALHRLHEPAFVKEPECQKLARAILNDARLLEDDLGEIGQGYLEADEGDTAEAFAGESPEFMVVGGKSDFAFQSGDLLISRTGPFAATAFAKMLGQNVDFSQIDLVYIEPESGDRWVVGSHLETGARIKSLESYLDEGKVRAAVYRFRDAKLAANAAAFIYAKVRDPDTEKIAFDFNYDFKSPDALSGPELVSHAFSEVSAKKTKFYTEITRPLNRPKKGLFDEPRESHLERLGIPLTAQQNSPVDFENDARLDLVAEWRDLSRINEIHLQDATLSAMYRWFTDEHYVLHEDSSGGLRRLMGWRIRRWPLFSKALKTRTPAGMTPELYSSLVTMNKVAEMLLARLERVSDTHFASTHSRLTPSEMQEVLETYRKEDLKKFRVYEKTRGYDPLVVTPDFHLLFNKP